MNDEERQSLIESFVPKIVRMEFIETGVTENRTEGNRERKGHLIGSGDPNLRKRIANISIIS